jgi:hypothetical protein
MNRSPYQHTRNVIHDHTRQPGINSSLPHHKRTVWRVKSMLSSEVHHIQDALLPIPASEVHDPLDEREFSIEDTLNQLLEDITPNEGVDGSYEEDSLEDRRPYARLDGLQFAVQERVRAHRRRMVQLNGEITQAQADDTMSQAQEQIADLFTQIHHLRSGATESEIIVRDITREIKSLDVAKKNITSSITGLKRFQMLLVAFDQLEKQQLQERRYKETAQALSVSWKAFFWRTLLHADCSVYFP